MKQVRLLDPQRINLYSYVRNNPLKYVDPTGEDITITVTNREVGNSHVSSHTQREIRDYRRRAGDTNANPPGWRQENVSTYRVTVRNETGSQREFEVTRDTNRNGAVADRRGLYFSGDEAPSGNYRGHIRQDGGNGYRVEVYDPNVRQAGDRDTVHATVQGPRGRDQVIDRTNIQIHIGPGCSEGCLLLTNGNEGRREFQRAITDLQAEDQKNNHGDDIYVNIQERNENNPQADANKARERRARGGN